MLVGTACLGDCICLVIAFVMHILAEVFIVDLVAVFALNSGTCLFSKLHLSLTLHLDGIVGCLERGKKVGFRHLAHFAFHHHDIVVGSTYHKFHIGALKLLESRVDDKLTVDTGYTHLRDRSVKWNVAHCKRG